MFLRDASRASVVMGTQSLTIKTVKYGKLTKAVWHTKRAGLGLQGDQ